MITIVFSIYIIIGSAFVIQHAEDIIPEVPNPEDLLSIIITGLGYVSTWPFWAIKK